MDMSVYDDPRLRPEDDGQRIKFEQRGDRVRGQIVKVEPLNTVNGWVAKYWIWDIDRNVERTLLAGATSLWGQLLTLKPEPLDVIDITLIDFQTNQRGTAKIFDVQVLERQARPLGPMAARPQQPAAYPSYQPTNAQAPQPAPAPYAPSQPQAPAPAQAQASPTATRTLPPAYADEDEDLFER
jgi:hypothetical protein